MFACIYRPPSETASPPLAVVAAPFSPRYEQHRDDLVSIDLAGLQRLFGTDREIGEELRRTARLHQVHVQVAIAGTRTAAMLLAQARPGLTVVAAGDEAAALAPLPIAVLARAADHDHTQRSETRSDRRHSVCAVVPVLKTWGIRTLGELAALPPADLSARLGQDGLAWQARARGDDARPLVPTRADERFESSLELEWPIDGLEPLSFVLTRLLEPLIVRLERRDRGAAAIVTALRLVTRETCTRRLELPTPLRDLRALRTLVLLDLDSHPPGAGIDAVTVTIEPTPGRILQHTLFTRPMPTPEQLSTLVARLHALMGQARVGAPRPIDSYRPGAFAMKPFAIDHDQHRERRDPESGAHGVHGDVQQPISIGAGVNPVVAGALRRCRQPVPARVAVEDGRPVRVTTDRRGYAGGRVVRAAGPWRVSGHWWSGGAGEPGADKAGESGRAGEAGRVGEAGDQGYQAYLAYQARFGRDEWDVELADGSAYRVFRDEFSDRWFIDAIYD